MRLSLSPTLAFTAGAVIATLVTASLLRKRKRTAEEHLWSIVRNSFTGALLHVGDKLNLYEILAETGPTTPQALARRTGWSERWLQEFLAQAAAAGICVYDEFTFTFAIRPDYARLLRDPKVSAVSMAGMFQFLLPLLKRADSVEQAIRTGLGVDYDFGVDGIEAMDRKNSNWFRDHLVKDLLSKVTVPSTNQTLVQLLESGVNVADIGCGCGSSTLVMAKRFPNSHFYAYEASVRSLGILSRRIEEQCLSNVSVCNIAERSVRDGPHSGGEFLFAYSHDVIHVRVGDVFFTISIALTIFFFKGYYLPPKANSGCKKRTSCRGMLGDC